MGFKTALVLKATLGGYYLARSYVYSTDEITIAVPSGFFSDLASIPWLFRRLIARDDQGVREASILHDWLYSRRSATDHPGMLKREADCLFLQVMLDLNTPRYQAYLAYWAVALFGRRFFRK